MKILKTIAKVLIVIIALGAVFSIFLPSMRHVERSIEIAKDPSVVFSQVNNLKAWKNWSYWDNLDSNMVSKYEGPEEGAGAKHSWESEHPQVGVGSMTITAVTAPQSISTELQFEDMISKGGWTFDKSETGTKATIFMDIELGFAGRIFPGLMIDKWLGRDFEETLSNLKEWCEQLPEAPSATWTVEQINTTESNMLYVDVTCKASDIGMMLGQSYGAIGQVMGKQQLAQAGPVFAVYHKYSLDTVVFQACIPVTKAGKDDGMVKAAKFPGAKAVKLDYYGDYPGTEQAHYYIDEWTQKNNITISGSPWEEYVTDPMVEKDTSKWLTRIYYPVQ